MISVKKFYTLFQNGMMFLTSDVMALILNPLEDLFANVRGPLIIRVLLRLSVFLAHSTEGLPFNTDQPCIFIFLPTVTKIWN